MSTDPISALHHVLDQEAAALLAAQYDRLAAIAARKDQLLEEVSNEPRAVLSTLSARLNHNASLTERALSGFRDGQAEILRARAAAARLNSYGPSGQSTVIESPKPGKIHRA